MAIKTYDVEDILNTKIYDLYSSEPVVTIKAFIHDIFLKLCNNYYDYDHINDLLGTLFIGFVENKLIDGYVIRDDDKYIDDFDYKYSDAVELYNILVNTIFNSSINKQMEEECMNMKNLIFFVKNKTTEKIYKVIAVRNDKNGFPHFLIYENKSWIWKSAKYFELI